MMFRRLRWFGFLTVGWSTGHLAPQSKRPHNEYRATPIASGESDSSFLASIGSVRSTLRIDKHVRLDVRLRAKLP